MARGKKLAALHTGESLLLDCNDHSITVQQASSSVMRCCDPEHPWISHHTGFAHGRTSPEGAVDGSRECGALPPWLTPSTSNKRVADSAAMCRFMVSRPHDLLTLGVYVVMRKAGLLLLIEGSIHSGQLESTTLRHAEMNPLGQRWPCAAEVEDRQPG
jgi:hypothetical protein